jgi:hypothetical protein
MQVRVKNIKFKPLTLDNVIELYTTATVNVRYLKATINHFDGMVNTLTGKKDEALRSSYKRKVEIAKARLQDEQHWIQIYQHTLNKHHVTIN